MEKRKTKVTGLSPKNLKAVLVAVFVVQELATLWIVRIPRPNFRDTTLNWKKGLLSFFQSACSTIWPQFASARSRKCHLLLENVVYPKPSTSKWAKRDYPWKRESNLLIPMLSSMSPKHKQLRWYDFWGWQKISVNKSPLKEITLT